MLIWPWKCSISFPACHPHSSLFSSFTSHVRDIQCSVVQRSPSESQELLSTACSQAITFPSQGADCVSSSQRGKGQTEPQNVLLSLNSGFQLFSDGMEKILPSLPSALHSLNLFLCYDSQAERDFPLQFNNKLFTLQGEVGAWSSVTLMTLAGE